MSYFFQRTSVLISIWAHAWIQVMLMYFIGRVRCILVFLYIAVCLVILCRSYYFLLIFCHITFKTPLRCVYIVSRFDLPHSLVMSSQMGIFLLAFDPFQIHFYLFPMSRIKLEPFAVLISCLRFCYIHIFLVSLVQWKPSQNIHLFCSVYAMFFFLPACFCVIFKSLSHDLLHSHQIV